MGIAVGVVLALCIGRGATALHADRDRAFYPTIMIVIASYYLLFALMAGSLTVLGREAIPASVFIAASVLGFTRSLRLVIIALLGHGVFDLLHGQLIANPGVPEWWPSFCLAYDVTAGVYLAWLVKTGRIQAKAG